MTAKWYQKSFRRNLVDMHIDDWNEQFLSEFDPEKYYDCLKRARIQSPMIYLQSHIGLCNWPTESGKMHAGFGGENKIKRLTELCRQGGMDVIAYYSLIYNNWAYAAHPEWRMVNIHGLPSRSPHPDGKQGRYGNLCPNNEGYREFLKAQFAELCAVYDFEAIFLDMTFWPMICYCDSCKARFLRETGSPLPTAVDWSDSAWLRFQRAREEWMGEFARFATAEMKKCKPGVDVEHQFSTATHPWTFGVDLAVSDASDYTGGDLYGGFEQQSYISKLYYGITKAQPFEYMTSRCEPNLNDHTTTKSFDMLRLHNYLTLAHHGAFLIIDAIDPRGSMNAKFYDLMGKVFAESMPYEPFLRGHMKADIGVLFSLRSKMNPGMKGWAGAPPHDERYPHLEASLGAGRALRRAHVPYMVVANGKLREQADNYKVIIVPDAAFISEEEKNILAGYVKNGGKLYLSGGGGDIAGLLRDLLGITITGTTAESVTYVRPCGIGRELFCGQYDERYPMTYFGQQATAELPKDKDIEVLAHITLPYTDPADGSVMASIHSNPPGIDTDLPSVVCGNYGKGKVMWSAAPIEKSDNACKCDVFLSLIRYLHDGADMIRSDAPHNIEFTVFEDGGRLFFHCVNLQEHFPMIKTGGFHVGVRTDSNIVSVSRLPDNQPVPFEQKDGYVNFRVEDIDIFQMYLLE